MKARVKTNHKGFQSNYLTNKQGTRFTKNVEKLKTEEGHQSIHFTELALTNPDLNISNKSFLILQGTWQGQLKLTFELEIRQC